MAGSGPGTRQNARVANQTSVHSWRDTDFTVHKSRWARLPFGVRMTVGAVALLLPCVGGIFAVSAVFSGSDAGQAVDRYASIVTSDSHTSSAAGGGTTADPPAGTIPLGGTVAGLGGAPGVPHAAEPGSTDAAGAGTVDGVIPGATLPAAPNAPGLPSPDSEMPMGGTPVDPTTDYEPAPVSTPPVPQPADPVVVTSTVTETEAVPFETQFIRDRSMPRRTHEVRVPGEQGVKTFTYEVTTTDGQQTGKRLVSEAVTKDPVTRVIAIGTGRTDCNDGDGDDGDDGGDGDGGHSRSRCGEPGGS
jgi:hypothetical protein